MNFGSRTDYKTQIFWGSVFCILANFTLFGICYYLKLPFRLEHMGTFFAAVAMGAGPALIVGIICQIFLSLFYFGFSTILYFLVTSVVVILLAVFSKTGWLHETITSLGAFSLVGLIYTFGNALLALFLPNMLQNSFWNTVSSSLETTDIPLFFRTLVTVGGMRLWDYVVMITLLLIFFRITSPKTSVSFRR